MGIEKCELISIFKLDKYEEDCKSLKVEECVFLEELNRCNC